MTNFEIMTLIMRKESQFEGNVFRTVARFALALDRCRSVCRTTK